ncbi:hypothetical protein FQN55_003271 [Onygenales sp. PD_40]|nr:hypothetical protein FQN55_003271 [Onygenales sp. PD_40]KAK2799998.1 hypothetical protein FQN51_006427 [Onygenales sp. PD_10]
MRQSSNLLLALAASLSSLTPHVSAETVLGAYVFARHGDRTSKSTPPTELTSLGYSQVYSTGQYYHDRYISSSSDSQILGISPEIVKAGQLVASAPDDEVLQKSALAFFQALYPPAGRAAKITLRNGTEIDAPMDGYQLIAIDQVSNGGNSENLAWLQSASKCQKAKVSSNEYFTSKPYEELLESTADFYKSLTPMLERTFEESEINYKNAYVIFDLLNVAMIHNSTDDLPADKLPSEKEFARLVELANIHEYNLAFNESSPIRAFSGSTLAGEVLSGLKEVISSGGATTKLNVQFGAYATFLAFFGLAHLPEVKNDFTGVPDYASSMSFELVTDASTSDSFPDASDISVRFLFANGSTTASNEPSAYPLFGQSETLMPWSEFESRMKKISISTEAEFCEACSDSPETCSAGSGDDSTPTTTSASVGGKDGMSKAVAGVVGALVTLAVILGLEALIVLAGGFRLVRKSKIAEEAAKDFKADA